MRACDDGYPTCRGAESGRDWCKSSCIAAIEKELKAEQSKSEKLTAAYVAKTNSAGFSRAQTTTYNANKGQIQERINFLRSEIKKASA